MSSIEDDHLATPSRNFMPAISQKTMMNKKSRDASTQDMQTTDLSNLSSKIGTIRGPVKMRNNSHVPEVSILSPTHFSPSMHSGAQTRKSKQTYFVDTRQNSSRGLTGKAHMTSSQRLDSPIEETRMTPKRIEDDAQNMKLPAI